MLLVGHWVSLHGNLPLGFASHAARYDTVRYKLAKQMPMGQNSGFYTASIEVHIIGLDLALTRHEAKE